ncbi:hypothetical protein A176_007668 [Myxococcus hansupus]|uniref:Uncharacterized protein n=1 Tax=Pseudomyxococcus hansupus TaxID=1297742 RepID=A0A0H4X4U7_9BACT|nr:hypothetical protein A176_007668 [Myxococcus hansupus]
MPSSLVSEWLVPPSLELESLEPSLEPLDSDWLDSPELSEEPSD